MSCSLCFLVRWVSRLASRYGFSIGWFGSQSKAEPLWPCLSASLALKKDYEQINRDKSGTWPAAPMRAVVSAHDRTGSPPEWETPWRGRRMNGTLLHPSPGRVATILAFEKSAVVAWEQSPR